ncbi:MAG: hypothetical protein ACT4N5_05715 [Nitrosopumilaceae archaeon]
MAKSILQYYCGNCDGILKETEESLSLPLIEPCPFCGTLLSGTLQRRSLNQRPKTSFPEFQRASHLPRLTLNIPKLDSILHFLTLDQKICITGVQTQKLIERICIRAQLPSKYGGLGTKVLLVDGANSSDIYQCVDFAQKYGLDVKKALKGIVTTRTFTVYQLANFIIYELENAIKSHDVKLVVITNLLYYFTNDPYLDTSEMQQIIKEVIKSLEKINNCLVIVSLGSQTRFDNMILQLFSSTIKITPQNNVLSVDINNQGRQHSITLLNNELEKVQ